MRGNVNSVTFLFSFMAVKNKQKAPENDHYSCLRNISGEKEVIQQRPTNTGNAITKTEMVILNGLSKAKERTLIVGEVEGIEEGGVDVGIEVGYACRLTRKSKGVRVGIARAIIASGVNSLYALYKTWGESKSLVLKNRPQSSVQSKKKHQW